MASHKNISFDKTLYLYTPLFCEENIWQLIRPLTNEGIALNSMSVVFMSNPEQKTPLRNQLAVAENELVVWDYHVILLAPRHNQVLVFDFDSRLPFGVETARYVMNTFLEPLQLPDRYRIVFRKIPARHYLRQFHSDRSHMLEQISETEFPPWPIINEFQNDRIGLHQYLDMSTALKQGSEECLPATLKALIDWLTSPA
jgi:hypothetical protein